MSEREEQIHEAVLDTWAKHIPAADPVRRAQMARGLATADQITAAKESIERAKRDPEFGRKVLAGNMDARERWASWHFVAYHCREAPADYDWSKDTI
jgi:hypothetical protein